MPTMDQICFHCGLSIDDLYYLMIMDQSWHLSCLKCSDCGQLLENEQTCFTKHGYILCKNDYIKYVQSLFFNEKRRSSSHVCAHCEQLIQPDEIILRAEQLIFHVKCFTCTTCNILLHSGDEFGIRENSIYCREHLFEENLSKIHDDSGYQTSPNETYKSKNYSDEIFSSYFIESDKSYQSKQKRLRTSFKHHQLRFMRSYFNLNHNPDAKDLKNLSDKTNLPKRVLQVWFQNARAKYRRSHILSGDDRINLSSPDNFHQSETSISIV
ncbi:hypothetical protein I4U23_026901 [Adineta vaga]|nr:hypothetical protein I4U23_026901 [Adineta vaga]